MKIQRLYRGRKKQPLVLVTLNEDQIALAKAANGSRKRITHALICGSYGQLFGSERQCLKYYSAWKEIFPRLFSRAIQTSTFEIADFDSTFDLVTNLINANDRGSGNCRN